LFEKKRPINFQSINQSINQSTVLRRIFFSSTHNKKNNNTTQQQLKKRIYDRKEKRLSSSSSSRGYARVYTQLLYFPKRERDRPTGVLFRVLLLRKE
jgi:hypothetical protein